MYSRHRQPFLDLLGTHFRHFRKGCIATRVPNFLQLGAFNRFISSLSCYSRRLLTFLLTGAVLAIFMRLSDNCRPGCNGASEFLLGPFSYIR